MKKINSRVLQNLQLKNETEFDRTTSGAPFLALDWGSKNCGLAWTPDGSVCLPLGIFSLEKTPEMIKKIAQKKSITTLVVGLPLSENSTENDTCQNIRTFAEQFRSDFSVVFVNERGSSQATISPDHERIDDLAAAQILENYLREQKISKI